MNILIIINFSNCDVFNVANTIVFVRNFVYDIDHVIKKVICLIFNVNLFDLSHIY